MSANNRNFNYETWVEGANLFSTLCQQDKYDDAAYLMLSDTSHVDFDCEDRLRFYSMYESKVISPCNPYLFKILKMSAEPDYKKNISDYLSRVEKSFKDSYSVYDIAIFCCVDLENDYLLDVIDNFDKTSNKVPHRIYFRCLDRFLGEDKSEVDKKWCRAVMDRLLSKAVKLGVKIEDYAEKYIDKIYSILSPYSVEVYFKMVGVFGEKNLLGVAGNMAKYFIKTDDLATCKRFIELCESVFNCNDTAIKVKQIIKGKLI